MHFIMKILRKNINEINHLLVVLIASTIVFRKIATPLILIFIILNLFTYKQQTYNRKSLTFLAIIASPFLLHILFMWNDTNFNEAWRAIEKVLSLLFFPFIILGNYKNYNLPKILYHYAIVSITIFLICLARFIIVHPDKIQKYINGVDLIEVGYQLAISMGTHAPALNMHMVFVMLIFFWLILQQLGNRNAKFLILIFGFLLAFLMVLIVNTRIALLNSILGVFVILFCSLAKKYTFKKSIVSFLSVSFILGLIVVLFSQINPYMIEKYSSVTFDHMDKIGKLDEIEDPEIHVFNSLVTRLSIWQSAKDLYLESPIKGYGAADAKQSLIDYFKKSDQQFLAKYEFPVHNQFLDYLLKFGILGGVVFMLYCAFPFFIGFKLTDGLVISFSLLYFISNLTDDFLIRFDGIVFSGLFITLFAAHFLKTTQYEESFSR